LFLVWAQPSEAQTTRAWIFVDCPRGEAVTLSDAARARRALRGRTPEDYTVAPTCRAALEAAGARLRVESAWLKALSADLDEAALARVQKLPFVRGLRPVARLAPQRTSGVVFAPVMVGPALIDYGPSQAQLAAINAILPLERGINGMGVKVGFLDTEYGDFQHPVFARMRSEGRLGGYRNFAQGPQSSQHGLNTSSVAVGYAEGNLVGPGWGATLFAATTEYAPTETNVEEDNFVRGLEWLESQGVDVVNVSLGYTTFDSGQRSYTYADLNGDTGVTTRAADAAAARGVVMVVSAGNEGGCSGYSASDGGRTCWYHIGTPADGDLVIAVGATTLAGQKALFSSFGPTADGRTKPDVSAPGQGIAAATGTSGYTVNPQTNSGTISGTSFSAPLVTGVVAQILQANPNLAPMEVRSLLRSTASQASNPDDRLGWGIVNADAAIREAARLVSTESDALAGAVQVRGNGSARPVLDVTLPAGPVRAEAFDLLGRRAALLHDGLSAGTLTLAFPDDLAAGAYLVRLTTNRATWTGTVVTTR
ncbi:MAG TPA: S8 family serine peptidase, partial [Rhodothermales bacterium]|nr:S8 family serine peptidase [Rhodothermales bacterium]